MNAIQCALQLRRLYEAEIVKLRAMEVRIEEWIDAVIQFRRDIDLNIANLSKAIQELNAKIEDENFGDGDDWLPRGTSASDN